MKRQRKSGKRSSGIPLTYWLPKRPTVHRRDEHVRPQGYIQKMPPKEDVINNIPKVPTTRYSPDEEPSIQDDIKKSSEAALDAFSSIASWEGPTPTQAKTLNTIASKVAGGAIGGLATLLTDSPMIGSLVNKAVSKGMSTVIGGIDPSSKPDTSTDNPFADMVIDTALSLPTSSNIDGAKKIGKTLGFSPKFKQSTLPSYAKAPKDTFEVPFDQLGGYLDKGHSIEEIGFGKNAKYFVYPLKDKSMKIDIPQVVVPPRDLQYPIRVRTSRNRKMGQHDWYASRELGDPASAVDFWERNKPKRNDTLITKMLSIPGSDKIDTKVALSPYGGYKTANENFIARQQILMEQNKKDFASKFDKFRNGKKVSEYRIPTPKKFQNPYDLLPNSPPKLKLNLDTISPIRSPPPELVNIVRESDDEGNFFEYTRGYFGGEEI